VERLLELIRGERKLVDVCREHDLKQSEVEGWMDTFVKAGERGLKANAEDEAAAHERAKHAYWQGSFYRFGEAIESYGRRGPACQVAATVASRSPGPLSTCVPTEI
jgi:hypothetical protein